MRDGKDKFLLQDKHQIQVMVISDFIKNRKKKKWHVKFTLKILLDISGKRYGGCGTTLKD